MLWMDKRLALLIRAEDTPGIYPGGGSRTEVYTNPDRNATSNSKQKDLSPRWKSAPGSPGLAPTSYSGGVRPTARWKRDAGSN